MTCTSPSPSPGKRSTLSPSTSSPDVIIVGGGIMGCMCALELAAAGLSVEVLERGIPGAEASSAAAGMLGPEFEIEPDSPLFPLASCSRELYEPLAQRLHTDHKIDIGFLRCGAFQVALEEQEAAKLRNRLAVAASGWGVTSSLHCDWEYLDSTGQWPSALAPTLHGVLAFPAVAQLDPRRLLPALAVAAKAAGVRFRSGETVHEVVVQREKATGLRLATETLHAAQVLVAAGSWTSLVKGLPLPRNAVVPVRGQILRCEMTPAPIREIVVGREGYVVTRPDGQMLCGSTEERVGFRKSVTVAGMESISRYAQRLLPAVGTASFLDCWSNFRPATADGAPLIGPAGPEGLYLATGHFRNGILWAPASAQLVTAMMLGKSPAGAEHFDPQRLLQPAVA